MADDKKTVLIAWRTLLCIGAAIHFLFFMISLPRGLGNQQPVDSFEHLTSSAPAYLPWKAIATFYIAGLSSTIVGLIAERKGKLLFS